MVGMLVASFPRRPRQHLKAQGKENIFPNHMSLVQRCQTICSLARGPGYLESESLNVYDAATSYFLALMGCYTFRWRQGRLYFGECLTITRTLGLHRSKEQTYGHVGALPAAYTSRDAAMNSVNGMNDQHADNIAQEMGRRIFWTMYVSIKTIQQLGAAFGELQINPPTNSEPYPPLPTEVDDYCIYATHIDLQPQGVLPRIAGFNANVKVYRSYESLSTMEMAWGIDCVVDWERQKKVLFECLRRCKGAISELPTELMVYPGGPFAQPGQKPDGQYMDEHRRIGCEIMKANIYASSLSTRSYIVEKYWNLCEAHARSRSQHTPGSVPSSPGVGITAAGIDRSLPQQPPTSGYDMMEHDFCEEHESIVKDLLTVLSSIDQVNMEPNADSFVSVLTPCTHLATAD
jgi:hypothetical protein